MHKSLRAAVLATTALFFPALAYAQGGIVQSGPVTRGHAAVWAGNGTLSDAGNAQNSFISTLGITSALNGSFAISSTNTGVENSIAIGVVPNSSVLMDIESPGTTGLPFIIENEGFPALTIDTAGTVNIPHLTVGTFSISGLVFNNATLSGTTLLQSGQVFNSPSIVLNGQIAPTPYINFGVVHISGTLGDGSATVPPPYQVFAETIIDQSFRNNAPNHGLGHVLYQFGNGSGTVGIGAEQLRQIGPQASDAAKPGGGGSFNAPIVFLNDRFASSDSSHLRGLVYGGAAGGNPKIQLLPGALDWGLIDVNSEVDVSVAAATETITVTGSVTGGETLNILATQSGPALLCPAVSDTVHYTAFATDSIPLIAQQMQNAIKNDLTFSTVNIGGASAGANSGTLNSQFAITWRGDCTLAVVPSITGPTGLVLVAGTQTIGASVGQKYGQAVIQLKQNGDQGINGDAVFYIGKQYSNMTSTAGGWQHLFTFGGNSIIDPQDDTSSISTSGWAFAPDADLFVAIPRTTSLQHDQALEALQVHSFASFENLYFSGGPLIFNGFNVGPDGSTHIGSVSFNRIVGTPGTIGLGITADGSDTTAVSIVNGGGAPNNLVVVGRYYVGDIASDGYGGLYEVTNIGSLGDVEGVQVLSYPSALNGVSIPGTIAVVGGSGTGWIEGITSAVGNTINIGGAGQTVNILGTTTGGAFISTNSTALRTLPNRGADVLNVKDFGAKGDGTTDDSVAINAAFTEARALISGGLANFQGMEIYFPYGVYAHSAGINATGLNAYPSTVPVTIRGEGATLRCLVGSHACLDLLGDSDVHIEGMLIRAVGNGVTAPTTGFQLGRFSTANADRNTVTNTEVTGSASVATCYNLASETNLWLHVQCQNSSGSSTANAVAFDGPNHFNVQSEFVTQTLTADTPNIPFNDMVCDTCDFRNTGGGPVIWMGGWLFNPVLKNTYALTNGVGVPVILNTGVNAMYGVNLGVHAETVTGTIANEVQITGTLATPTIHGFSFHDQDTFAHTSVFALSGSVTSVTLTDAKISIDNSQIGTIPLFDTAANYSLYGDVSVPSNADWTLPAAYAGRLELGLNHRYETTAGGPNNGGGYRVAGLTGLFEPSVDPNNSIYVGQGLGSVLTTGSFDVAVGASALSTITTGNFNTAIGEEALRGVTTASGNVALGYTACNATAFTGVDNTCIGAVTGASLVSGGFNILIGEAVDAVSSSVSRSLNIGNAVSGTIGGGTHPSICVIGAPCVIGQLRSADFNVTTDQAIPIGPLTSGNSGFLSSATKYKITDIFVTNCSTSLTTAQGAFYTATSKGGTIIGATTTPYTGCTGATTQQDATSLTNMNTSIFTAATLQLSLTTQQGGAATGDVYVVGIPFN